MLKHYFKSLSFRLLGAAAASAILVGAFYFLFLQVVGPGIKPLSRVAVAAHQASAALASEAAEPAVPAIAQKTVWVMAEASVAPEGTSVGLTVEERDCEVLTSPVTATTSQNSVQELGLTLNRGFCVAMAAQDTLQPVVVLGGSWQSLAQAELPELDPVLKQWSYRTARGQQRNVTLVALGYCESEDGGCASTISLQDGGESESIFARIALPGIGVAPIFLQKATQ